MMLAAEFQNPLSNQRTMFFDQACRSAFCFTVDLFCSQSRACGPAWPSLEPVAQPGAALSLRPSLAQPRACGQVWPSRELVARPGLASNLWPSLEPVAQLACQQRGRRQ